MFTMPAIHHSSVRADDGCMGGMHLNAINGSSNALGFGSFSGGDSSEQKGVFGNIFGGSISDSPIYKRQDSGLLFRDSQIPSSSASETYSRYMPSDRENYAGHRRRSLDVNAMCVKPHPRVRDRSLSVGEIVIGRVSRFDAIYENELARGLNLGDLSLREIGRRSSDSHEAESRGSTSEGLSKTSHGSYRKKGRHASDAGLSSKSVKLLEKIKDNINHKHSRSKSDYQNDEQNVQTTSSKTASSKHNKARRHSDSTQENQEQIGHHRKQHTIRTSAD